MIFTGGQQSIYEKKQLASFWVILNNQSRMGSLLLVCYRSFKMKTNIIRIFLPINWRNKLKHDTYISIEV